MESSFERWLPEGAQMQFYDVLDVRFASGLQIRMGTKDHTLLLYWPRFVCCQVSDEAYREDCWVSNPTAAWSFFVSEDSELLQSYRAQSHLLPDAVRHYRLVGANEIVDLLSQDEPTITFPGGGNHDS